MPKETIENFKATPIGKEIKPHNYEGKYSWEEIEVVDPKTGKKKIIECVKLIPGTLKDLGESQK